jgi:putative restriction endonuclease
MVNIFVAITDDDWFSYLAAQPRLDEVNFWQPRGKAGFQAIKRGELFLFKLHSPRNFIVGGGIFDRASSSVPLWLAWDSFGTLNGADTFEEMRRRISRYTHQPADDRTEIGCRLLRRPFFCRRRAGYQLRHLGPLILRWERPSPRIRLTAGIYGIGYTIG